MKKIMAMSFIVMLVAAVAFAQTFTDVDTTKHQGKTGLKDLITVLDANFALVEAGADRNVGALTVNTSITAISTNDATTNVVVTVNGQLDGETLADDSVDDDAIDFGDVTGADLTLTDCTAVTATGLVKGGTLGIGSGVLQRTGTALEWVEGGITNVLDADVTTP